MIQCANCGQVNTDANNFCRFCGTRFLQSQMQNESSSNYEYSPPQPYSWKTDEFQVNEQKTISQTQAFKQVTPLTRPLPPNLPPRPEPIDHRQPNSMNYGYRCPRCGTNAPPTIVRKISTAGWITFAVLMALFLPLFWIGLLIREDAHICPVCNLRIT